MTTLGVITNPASGSGRGAHWGPEALAGLAARGFKIRDLSRGSWGGALEASLKYRDELDAVIAVGGDGIVHLATQVCAETKMPMGIIAAGSGNDAARALNLPVHNIKAGIDRVVEGLEQGATAIDVGRLEGANIEEPSSPRYFVCVLSAGMDAAVAKLGSGMKFPRGPMKYKVATFRELARFSPYGAKVTVDGFTWEAEAALVAVANTSIFGGGLICSPEASVTDGLLDVVVASDVSKLDIVKLFQKIQTDGSHIEDPRVKVVKGKKITIEHSPVGRALPAAFADGELVGGDPFEVSVARAGLNVLGARTP